MTAPEFSFTIRSQVFSAPKATPGLYLVATPIGNLGDITLRALETLAGCDVIACEDTRTSGVLLKRYSIDRPKVSYTEHNAERRGPDLLRQIGTGAAIALISDAGTPLVSDPGFRLVREAVKLDLPVVPLPGASAPLAAIVGSGLGEGDFRFCGFLPTKTQAKKRVLQGLTETEATLLFFESPARIKNTLGLMQDAFGETRQAVIARELTKMHETFHRGTLMDLSAEFSAMESVRGEIVVVVEPAAATRFDEQDVTALLAEALKTQRTKEAAQSVAEQTGLPRQALYKQALDLKNE